MEEESFRPGMFHVEQVGPGAGLGFGAHRLVLPRRGPKEAFLAGGCSTWNALPADGARVLV